MQCDAGLTGQVDECGGVSGHDVLHVALGRRDLDRPDPAGEVAPDPLLHDPLALDPVWIALEVQGAAGDVCEHRRRDLFVVAGELGLGHSGRDQELARTRDLDFSPGHDGRSRTTSRGALSSRSP